MNFKGTEQEPLRTSKEIVNESHSLALKNGATNEGSPGLRKGYGNVYYSYIRDLDQNKICIYSED